MSRLFGYNDVQAYFRGINQGAIDLFNEGKRDSEGVYLVSSDTRENRSNGILPGRVTLTGSLKLASQCIIHETHRRASAAEIAQFEAEEKVKREAAMAAPDPGAHNRKRIVTFKSLPQEA